MEKVEIKDRDAKTVLQMVGSVADEMGVECYVVGGYVRDFMLSRRSDDMDFVVVGSGMELARRLAEKCGTEACLYESYGTAKVTVEGYELEFVGARKEFYHRESRNPIVEDGTLEDDLSRRDFTINSMAICLNAERFGQFVDPNNGLNDLAKGIIRCVGNPSERFSEDPLRMLRCIRFASRFGFFIDPETEYALVCNAHRLKIITRERIVTELNKMLLTDHPTAAMRRLYRSGILTMVLPEVADLAIGGDSGHKDNLNHTMTVLSNVAKETDDLWVRWAALLHDIGKKPTGKYDINEKKWTFTNHDTVGAEMVATIFRRLGLPLDERMEKVKTLVKYHMRPKTLCEDGVTDSAVRRLLFDLGNDVDDLMLLCKADITTKYSERKEGFWKEYDRLVERIHEVEEKDHVRNFQPPVDGNEIMEVFGLTPSKAVGELKEVLKNAVLDGLVANDHDECLKFLKEYWRKKNA